MDNIESQTIDKISENKDLQFLTFTIGSEEYGVDIMLVKEIKGWTQITRMPNTPEYMLGIMNLRGSIIPIFDLRYKFGMGHTEANIKNVVIIMNCKDRTIGILVDTVSDILDINANELQKAPEATDSNIDNDFINGIISVNNRMVVVLNIEALFESDHHNHTENQ